MIELTPIDPVVMNEKVFINIDNIISAYTMHTPPGTNYQDVYSTSIRTLDGASILVTEEPVVISRLIKSARSARRTIRIP